MFAKIGTNLREYVSNSEAVNRGILPCDRAPDGKIKLLGARCDTVKGEFSIQTGVQFKDRLTKRDVVNRSVSVQNLYDRGRGLSTLADEHSAWVVDLEVLKVCVHAEKKMSTIRMTLKIPVTIATLIMLVSPPFDDLRTQVYTKLFILSLQTICFLYLCSIPPRNDTYYELTFAMSSVNLLMTLTCIVLSRLKRTTSPTHRFYLAAKLDHNLDNQGLIPFQGRNLDRVAKDEK
ncbi:unnamed protein product [Nippostrongylus brasiliensis]|uniref:G_PROTEIN_RECEP_F3_4 domain-containing protein n=1 Tax=Nippostrongylus brasiliensis TaxID=27835 RepID=A0A0N4YGV8_NIPBR|nr:unnamed protein product [Nippostrongylus brasiliensis]